MQPSEMRESPQLVRVLLPGRVTPQEWNAALGEAAKLLRADERTAMLVTGSGFEGWDPGPGRNDLPFRRKPDGRVGRMAIVADRRWEDRAVKFTGQGPRRFDVEFFAPAELPRARAWLATSA
jgi:hypothetical protein